MACLQPTQSHVSISIYLLGCLYIFKPMYKSLLELLDLAQARFCPPEPDSNCLSFSLPAEDTRLKLELVYACLFQALGMPNQT